MVRSATSRSSSFSSSSFFLLSFFRCCLPFDVPADAAPPERPLTRFFAMCNDLKERTWFTSWGRQVLARALLHTTTVFLPSLLIPFSRSSRTEGDRSRGGKGEEKGRDKREERNKATIIIHHGLFNYYTLFPPFSFCFCSNVPSSTPLHSYRYSFDGAIKMFPPFPHLLLAKALYGHPSSSFASYSSLSRSSHRHRFLFFFFLINEQRASALRHSLWRNKRRLVKWPLSVAPSKIGEKSGVSSFDVRYLAKMEGGYSSPYTSRPSDNFVFSPLEFRVTWSKYEDLGDMLRRGIAIYWNLYTRVESNTILIRFPLKEIITCVWFFFFWNWKDEVSWVSSFQKLFIWQL